MSILTESELRRLLIDIDAWLLARLEAEGERAAAQEDIALHDAARQLILRLMMARTPEGHA